MVGRAVDFNKTRFTIIGVMPAGFSFPIQSQPTEVWVSTAVDNERPMNEGSIMVARGYLGWRVIGRLKTGATREQAQSEADVIAAGLAAPPPLPPLPPPPPPLPPPSPLPAPSLPPPSPPSAAPSPFSPASRDRPLDFRGCGSAIDVRRVHRVLPASAAGDEN